MIIDTFAAVIGALLTGALAAVCLSLVDLGAKAKTAGAKRARD
jgi:hypothetical protein